MKIFIGILYMKPSCYFQIPRGNNVPYVFVFYLYGNTYTVLLKQKLAGPYKIIGTYRVPVLELQTFINTTVASIN